MQGEDDRRRVVYGADGMCKWASVRYRLNNTCPYCNGGSNFINFSTQSDSDFGKTVAPCAYVKKQEKDHRTIGVFQK